MKRKVKDFLAGDKSDQKNLWIENDKILVWTWSVNKGFLSVSGSFFHNLPWMAGCAVIRKTSWKSLWYLGIALTCIMLLQKDKILG